MWISSRDFWTNPRPMMDKYMCKDKSRKESQMLKKEEDAE